MFSTINHAINQFARDTLLCTFQAFFPDLTIFILKYLKYPKDQL